VGESRRSRDVEREVAGVDLCADALEKRDLGIEHRAGAGVDRRAHDPALARGVDHHRRVELRTRRVGAPDVKGIEPGDGDGRQGSESEW